ncbi:hypothetical protein [Halorussus litoreus]|uniref:hypothetical protein n=1 Tax=Halorussus litoreus TaxID=1710536 RepID=UPI000E23B1C7|nr:hypothetical protein [Halorussus litoreus]
MNPVEFLRRHPAVLVLVVLAPVIAAAWRYLPLSTAIRAVFLVVAFLTSVAVFYATNRADGGDGTDAPEREIRGSDWTYAKILTIAAGLAICATVWLGSRAPWVAAFLGLGYLAVAYQLRRDAAPTALLYELVLLFAVPLFAKFLTTGLYFGGGDVLRHVTFVNRMLDAGSVLAIQPSAYWMYPGFHLLVGSFAELLGLTTYDAMVLTGLVAYSALVPLVYLTVRALWGDEAVAFGTVIAFTLLLVLKPYVLAFYPQALAVAMLFVGVYLNASLFTAETARAARRYAAVVPLLAVAMATTHHLTFVIALVPLGLLLGLLVVQRGVAASDFRSALSRASNVQVVYAFPLLIAAVVLFAYWLYTPSIFLTRMVGGLVTFFVLTTGGGEGGGIFLYGVGLVTDDVRTAIRWLYSPDGIYYALLSGLLLVAFYETVQHWRRHLDRMPLLATGLILSGLLLPLPLPVPWLDRIRLLVAIVAVFPLGVALSRLARTNPRYPRYAVGALVLIAAGASASFAAPVARDLDSLHTDKQRVQIEYGEREYRTVQSLSSFLDDHAATTNTGTQLIRNTFLSEGYRGSSIGLSPEEDGMSAAAGLMIVREEWTDHKLLLVDGSQVTISDDRFAVAEARRNKVYESGGTSLFWSDSEFVGVFGRSETASGNATPAAQNGTAA